MSQWFAFLDARMLMIQEFRKDGKTPEQIAELINIKGMQTIGLCMEADKRNNNVESEAPVPPLRV